jgi:hypothetical protein
VISEMIDRLCNRSGVTRKGRLSKPFKGHETEEVKRKPQMVAMRPIMALSTGLA